MERENEDIGGVAPGHKVTLLDIQMKESATFTLVHPDESDLKNAKLSFLSPLGSRLIGCTLGDVVEINIFGRKETFHVIGIEHELM